MKKSMLRRIIREEIRKSLNEAIDLSAPVKQVRKQLDDFSRDLDNKRGGSFDGDSGEYHDFEGGDSKLYEKRYKKLSQWHQKVKKTLDNLMKDYENAWRAK